MRRIFAVLFASLLLTISSLAECDTGNFTANDNIQQTQSSETITTTEGAGQAGQAGQSGQSGQADVAGQAGLAGQAGQADVAANSGAAQPGVTAAEKSELQAAATVFMTASIDPAGLMAVYEALEVSPVGKVAVKISTGEPPNSNYLRPELIKDLVQAVNGAIVECNTAYGGSRASNAMHLQVAKDHGFTDIAEFDLMDADGDTSLPVEGGDILTEDFVGANFANYDFFIILSHFKGHAMAGYGGAIKNSSIGIASSRGKSWIHSGGKASSGISGAQDAFLMAMAEANKAVSDSLGGGENIIYINVMNRLSVDCDCNGRPAEPDMHDIGILASHDPVALDKACLDLVYAASDSASLVKRIESRNGALAIEHGEAIGLGTTHYVLVDLDK